ncbi:hypothetical protein AAFN60_19235 [Roseibacillus persicicus]|uniref:hypothetical protein n=1 Tax=Roseibacillus persicicus TaxID=454148 RepID=UPI00398AE633
MKFNLPNEHLVRGALGLLALLLTSCSSLGIHTTGYVKKREQQSYQKGFNNGRAHEVRAQVHREQQERRNRPAVPKTVSKQIMIPAHQAPDGTFIEAHPTIIQTTEL